MNQTAIEEKNNSIIMDEATIGEHPKKNKISFVEVPLPPI
jgi:hypothetical protein